MNLPFNSRLLRGHPEEALRTKSPHWSPRTSCGDLFRLLVLLLICGSSSATSAAAASWFVSPSGDDDNSGSLEAPFATVGRAQDAASPGDTIYFRGGVYQMRESDIAARRGLFARVIVLGKSGLPGRPITYRCWDNERPCFDFSDVRPAGQRVTGFYVRGSWLHLKGLEVTGVQVTIRDHTQSICIESHGSHNIFERLALHDGQAIGIYHVRGSDNLFLNCDAWNNWDRTSEDGVGENVDGFGCHPPPGSTGNVFRGCRAWFNSDDGFDCISADEAVTFENCWACYNGYSPDMQRLANGNGFKAGGYGSRAAGRLPLPIPRHVVKDCLAVGNKANGFYANHHPGGCDWLNNVAWDNGAEFNMLGRLDDNVTDVDGRDHHLVGNLSFGSRYGSRRILTEVDQSQCELTGNRFSDPPQLSSVEKESLQRAELTAPRDSDGNLPEIVALQNWRPLVPTAASSQLETSTERNPTAQSD
ncbi:MAG: right-handed parallel beta-helix repeat-containing protein [Planctomycetaceae bacterium]|nr:right-handed parallel beta-helix repeat-containing protein [Planctomycetaceae bacterium]